MREGFENSGGLEERERLDECARVLKESDLFVGNSDLDRMIDKQLLFLLLSGEKKVCEVYSGHWENVEGGRKAVADDPEKVKKLLDDLGLKYKLTVLEDIVVAIVAKDEKYIDIFLHGDGEEQGVALGYPVTAARAWREHGKMGLKGWETSEESPLLTADEHDEKVEKIEDEGVRKLAHFRLSKKNYEGELKTVERWGKLLGRYGLI
jgi:hypothetical protein